MNKKDFIILFLCIFFTTISSIALHEFVHVLQYSSAGYEIEEVCLLSYQDGKAGWVKFSGEINGIQSYKYGEIYKDEYELQAYAISIIYHILMFIILIFYLFKSDVPRESSGGTRTTRTN